MQPYHIAKYVHRNTLSKNQAPAAIHKLQSKTSFEGAIFAAATLRKGSQRKIKGNTEIASNCIIRGAEGLVIVADG